MRRALFALLGLWLCAPVLGCIPIYLPPGRVDVGVGTRAVTFRDPRVDDSTPPPGAGPVLNAPQAAGAAVLRVSGGVHLASLVETRKIPLDVGLGYVFNDLGWGDRYIHGGYLEVTPVLYQRAYIRLLAGGRGELLWPDKNANDFGWSALGHVHLESLLMVSGAGISNRGRGFTAGAAHGALGFGVFAEAGVQHLPAGEEAVLMVGGLSFRFPAVAGVLCCAH